ncbi:PH domain-containing protein [Actinomyces viscosus]|uniref:PH domain-containing protein n=1 Tax=Actinomyces viscosus TaxID=1656 RepID=UPI0028E20839|nr:PH domain-containing protein [Actinomyces viscosus]
MTSPAPVPASTPAATPVSEPGPRPQAGDDPFAPDGVVFHPVSPRLTTARLLGSGIVNAILVIGFVIPGVLVSPGFFVPAALAAVLFVWQLWLIPRQVRAMGYALADNHLLWRHGVMFRSMTVTPYGRMQFVDTSQGPLARWLGIAEVRLHTASASTDATINGLPVAEAENLRQVLSRRGEERMAGL